MIVPTADRSKASVMVKIRFLEPALRVLPEMSAKVAFLDHIITPAEEQPRVALNPGAVLTKNGGQTVFLVTGKEVKEIPVHTGGRIGDLLEVLDGVKAGDKVVVQPPKNLKNGSKIAIKEG